MPTNNPKISAYVPLAIYEAFNRFKEERKLSMSQAASLIFSEYFGIDLSKDESKEITGGLPSKVFSLEDKVKLLESLFYDLSHTVELLKFTSELSKEESVYPDIKHDNYNDVLIDDTTQANLEVDNIEVTSRLPELDEEKHPTVSNMLIESESDKSNLQLELLSEPKLLKSTDLKPMTGSSLSRRFGKEDGFVKAKKNYYKDRPQELKVIFKQCDPDGIEWYYSDKDKKYHPIINIHDSEITTDP